MNTRNWLQGLLCLVLAGLVLLSLPDTVYANSGGDADSASSGEGTSEDENYVNIEVAMREYNARYMYFKAIDHDSSTVIEPDEIARAPYVRWPECLGCGGKGEAPPKPEDETYKSSMQNKQRAVEIVEFVVDTFYSNYDGTKPLYAEFIKIEGETGTTFSAYTATDFPKSWEDTPGEGVTTNNYKKAAATITAYIQELKATDGSSANPTITGVPGESSRQGRSGSGYPTNQIIQEAFSNAIDDGIENMSDWVDVAWDTSSGPIYATSGCVWAIYPSDWHAYYSAIRGRIQFTGEADHQFTVYLQVLTTQAGSTVEPLSNQPVEGHNFDPAWHEFMTFSGAGTHYTPVLAGDDPEWAGDTDMPWPDPPNEWEGEEWSYTWEIDDIYVAKHPPFDTSPDGGCKTSCDSGMCAANQGGEFEAGSLQVRYGLGMLDDDRSAGYLQIHAQEPSSALFTPDMLQVVADTSAIEVIRESDLTPRQVKTDNLLIDIVVVNGTEYELRYYHASQISGAKSGTPAVYPLSGSAYRTIVVSKPEANNNNVRFSKKGDTGDVALVNQFVFDGTDTWDLYEGMDKTTPTLASALRRTSTKIEVSEDTRTETRKVMEADGTELSHVETIYSQYPFGWVMTSKVVDPDTAKLVEAWDYYTAPGSDGYGRIQSYVSDTGYWEHYVYDSDNVLSKTIQQLGDNQHDPDDVAQMEADNIVVEFSEYSGSKTIDGLAEDLLASKTTTTVEGVVEAVSYEVYRSDSEVVPADLDEVWRIRSASTDPENGFGSTLDFIADYMNDVLGETDTSGHLLTRTWTYKAGEADEFEVARSLSPDGTVTVYDYSTANTTVVERGFVNNPLAASPAMEYGTRTTTVVDDQGNMESVYVERAVKGVNSDAYFVVSYTLYTDDDAFGRPQTTEYYFGADAKNKQAGTGTPVMAYDTTRTYSDGCGCSNDQYETIDRYGVKTTHYLDDLGRTYTTVSAVGTSAEIYSVRVLDALGRATDSGVDGDKTFNDFARADNDDHVTTVTYDAAGRMTSSKDPEGRVSYTTYRRVKADGAPYNFGTDTGPFYWETRRYGHNDDVPVQVSWADSHGRAVVAFSVDLTWSGTPTGAEQFVAGSELTRSTSFYDWAGRTTESRGYFDLTGLSIGLGSVGVEGTHYLASGTTDYDALGRGYRRTDALGNITETVYESGTGRPLKIKAGIDTGALKVVAVNQYTVDIGGTDYPRPWVTRAYTVRPGLLAAPDDSTNYNHYVYTDTVETIGISSGALSYRRQWSRPQYGPWSYSQTDAEGRQVSSVTTKNGTTSYYLTAMFYEYDSNGRMYRADQRIVNSGVISPNHIQTLMSFDDAGRTVKTEVVGRGFTKVAFDAYGRVEREVFASAEYVGVSGDSSTYGANAFTDDVVLTEVVNIYDKSGRVLERHAYDRTHDAPDTATGLLSSASAAHRRVTYSGVWYDDNGRQTHSATYGTSDSYNPTTPPVLNGSSTVIASKVDYDDAGRAYLSTDNAGKKTRTYFDAMGRVTHVIENYTPGSMGDADDPESVSASRDADVNRVTKRVYDNTPTGGGAMIQLIALDSGLDGTGGGSQADDQVTHYIHSGELDTSKRGIVPVNGRPVATLLPDAIEDGETRSGAITKINNANAYGIPDSGSGGDFTYTEYYADGAVYRNVGPRGLIMQSTYTVEGYLYARVVHPYSLWLPPSGAEQLAAYTYGDAGELETVTTYSDIFTTQTSKITYEYDGYYNVVSEKADHKIGGGNEQEIAWAFDTTTDSNAYTKAYRPKSVTYPNGRVIEIDYGTTYDGVPIDDQIGRPSGLDDISTAGPLANYQITRYTYTGGGAMVRKDYPTPKVRLDFIDEATGEGSDADDPYELSLDRFGRPVRYQWEHYSGGRRDLIHIAHGYDGASNRLYDHRKEYSSRSVAFEWDGLDRIQGRDVGLIETDGGEVELDAGTGLASISSHWLVDGRDWALDQLGNPTTVDTHFGTARYGVEVNQANEITTSFQDADTPATGPGLTFSETSVDLDLFPTQHEGDGDPLSGGAVTISTGSGGDLTLSAGTATNPAIIVMDQEIGLLPFMSSLEVSSLPTGSVTGLVGYVFGYQSELDYWVYAKDMNSTDGDFKLYHMHDKNGDQTLDYTDPTERLLVNTEAAGNPAASTEYLLLGRAAYKTPDIRNSGSWSAALASGKVGLYTEVAGAKFRFLNHAPAGPSYPLGSAWETTGSTALADKGAGDGAIKLIGEPGSGYAEAAPWHAQVEPALLKHVRAKRFEVTFSVTRDSSTAASAGLVFNYEGPGEFDVVEVHHNGTITNPTGYEHVDGRNRGVLSGSANSSYLQAQATAGTKVWYRIVSDGTDVYVYSASSPATLDSRQSAGNHGFVLTGQFDFSGPAAGRIGFVAMDDTAYIDDVTIKTDPDNDANETASSTFENTVADEDFALETGGKAEDDFVYDAAGNLRYDGYRKLTYDGLNRLVMVEVDTDPSNDDWAGSPAPAADAVDGTVLATYHYDGNGRRIVEETYTADDAAADAVLNQYYIGWSVVETRDNAAGGGNILVQHVWDNLAPGSGMYIDSLAEIAHNYDPTSTEEDYAELRYYALQDQQYNVLGLVNASAGGMMVERYEYTLYGERQVFRPDEGDSAYSDADFNYDGDVDNSDLQLHIVNFTGPQTDPPTYTKTHEQGDTDGDGDVDNTDNQFAIASFTGPNPGADVRVMRPADGSYRMSSGVALSRAGFQGLRHDEESELIENRRRVLDAGTGRFLQRDPYPDDYPNGMDAYAMYHAFWGVLDPFGTRAGSYTPGLGFIPDAYGGIIHGPVGLHDNIIGFGFLWVLKHLPYDSTFAQVNNIKIRAYNSEGSPLRIEDRIVIDGFTTPSEGRAAGRKFTLNPSTLINYKGGDQLNLNTLNDLQYYRTPPDYGTDFTFSYKVDITIYKTDAGTPRGNSFNYIWIGFDEYPRPKPIKSTHTPTGRPYHGPWNNAAYVTDRLSEYEMSYEYRMECAGSSWRESLTFTVNDSHRWESKMSYTY